MKSNNKIILVTLLNLLTIFFLSGCLDQYGVDGYLDLELLTEDQLVSFNEQYLNLTLIDLSPFPTLKQAILKIIDPSTNITAVFVKITNDEMNRIYNEVLTTPGNDIYNFIAYYEYLFQIGFAVP